MNTIWLAFVTGLTAGGISCLAVQGGLLASSLSQVSENSKRAASGIFVASKIGAHVILGALLGLFGAALQITPVVQGWLQIFAGVYMLATAANILQLHPVFRFVVIQPPKWAYRLIKKESRREVFGSALLGALTILIPCGLTQGMMIAAVASGSAVTGALLLGAFTLGTSPLFLVIGIAAGEFMKKRLFRYAAAACVILLGILSINTGQALRGSIHTIQNYAEALHAPTPSSTGAIASINQEGVQEVTIDVTSSGYQSSVTKLKAGVPVRIKLVSNNAIGCSRAFTIPSMNLSKVLPENGEEYIEFTPTKTGRLAFSCSMGMYNGAFVVI